MADYYLWLIIIAAVLTREVPNRITLEGRKHKLPNQGNRVTWTTSEDAVYVCQKTANMTVGKVMPKLAQRPL